jgi:hypothetical protein
MSEHKAPTKVEFLVETERSWQELNALLASLTAAQMTTLKDGAGWTVKDHLMHIVCWERSVIFHMQGKQRYKGLGVDRALFASDDFDGVNAVIQEKNKDIALADALEQMRSTHRQMLDLIAPLSDADLQKPFRRWRAGESGEGTGPSLMSLIENNAGGHFAEHLPWIKTLVGGAGVG